MNVKDVLKGIGLFIFGAIAGFFGFFIRRRDISDIRRGIDEANDDIGRSSDSIDRAEDINRGTASIIEEGAGTVSKLEDELRGSIESADAIAGRIDEQSERLEEGKRILDRVKERGRSKHE